MANGVNLPKPTPDGVTPMPPAPSAGRQAAAQFASATTEVSPSESTADYPVASHQDLSSLSQRPAFPDQLTPSARQPMDFRHPSPVPSLPVTHFPTGADLVAYQERMSLIMTEALHAVRGAPQHALSPASNVGRFCAFLREMHDDPGRTADGHVIK
jgi:hypothetical protein